MTTLTILPAIETPHLLLREMREEDVEDLTAFVTQSRYQRYITHKLRNDAEVRAFVKRHILAQGDGRRRIYHLSAEETMSGEVVGDAFIISHADASLELGWGVHPALWRMGFGTEIGRALLALSFERLKAEHVWCKVMTANTASTRLARRIGMHLTGSQTEYPVGQGRSEPVDIYGLNTDAYFELPY
jgi:[ribosomal protein S5]-alanine N-acetyltransferase